MLSLAASSFAQGQVVVAVIDSGADLSHPALKGHLDPRGWDFADNDAQPQDVMPPKPEAPKCDPTRDRLSCFISNLGYIGMNVLNLIRPGAAGHGTHCTGIVAKNA